MAAEHPRIDELRRRIQQDPASIAFAQLAEEYRRSGDHEEAVRVCRAGLAHHPAYLSARVTLGRALMALGQNDDAHAEFEHVVQTAPDNLLARKCLDELEASGYTPAPRPETRAVEAAAPEPEPMREVAPGPEPASEAPATTEAAVPPAPDPVLAELEGWHAAIRADRTARASRGT